MAKTQGHGNPNWTREEIILALDLYFKLNRAIPSPKDEKVIELSRLLRRLPYHSNAARKPTFRNADGVVFKLQNLRQVSTGTGFANTSKLDAQVWQEFGAQPGRVSYLADQIRHAVNSLKDLLDADEPNEEFSEGKTHTILHKVRERDPRLRRRVLKARSKQGKLQCDICCSAPNTSVTDYEDAMFEVHHTIPISGAGERITRVKDVALLCANCHRLLHRAIATTKSWISIEEARAFIQAPVRKPNPV